MGILGAWIQVMRTGVKQAVQVGLPWLALDLLRVSCCISRVLTGTLSTEDTLKRSFKREEKECSCLQCGTAN